VYAAQQAGKKRVASIGYGVNDASKTCTNGTADGVKAFEPETGVDLVYTNDHLAYGLPNGIGPEVTAMKKAKVDFVTSCIDLNGMKTLAQELERQGMDDVVLFHPNTYNQQFIAEAGDLFEGDYVIALFRPFEADTAGTAVEQFEKWMDKEGSDQSELAMVGWINASLAYDGLLAAGPEFDREAVTTATAGLTAWTGGGVVAPINWATAHTPYTQDDLDPKQASCPALLHVEDHKLVTVGPKDKPFICWKVLGEWSEPTPSTFE
jgi:ABC-type branched-subunit amino acid transport system substrate-binding protein